MAGIRKALLYTSLERYSNLAVNFLVVAAVSRLLSPAEIGVSAFGVAVWVSVEVLRDIPSSYLVQQKDLSREDIRTAFTVMALISLAAVFVLIGSSAAIARLYDDPRLAAYLQVFALALLPGSFERPIMALFRRDMAFGPFAAVNVVTVLTNAAVTISLAFLGFGYMSFAWAALASSLACAALAIYFRPDFGVFRPHLAHWRRALRFGGTTAACSGLLQAVDMVPYIVLSRAFAFDAVGFYNRALLVSQSPNKLVLSGLSPVILPALASHARDGHDLKPPFLLAVSHISAVHWPAYLLLTLLAHPAVAILIGPQWFSIVPLVQIVALAMLASFASILIYPALMAVAALRHLLLWHLFAMPACIAISGTAALFGPAVLAASLLVTVPLQNAVGLYFVRRHAAFTWREFAGATGKSAVIALATIAVPGAYIASHGFTFAIPIATAIALGFGGVLGWGTGVWLTRHPLRDEMLLAFGALRRRLRREEAAGIDG